MNICVLGSGSKGNCIYIESGATRLLIDLGLNYKHTTLRLGAIGIDPATIQGILFTHDHTDHCQGARVFHKRHPETPLYANYATSIAIERRAAASLPAWVNFENGQAFQLGSFTIEPFSVPHDGTDPVAYAITDGTHKILIATDIGTPTKPLKKHIAGCDLVLIESNHDSILLQESDRDYDLIQRIRGPRGHLDNDDAAALIAATHTPRLQTVLLAHLSEDCNTERLALTTMQQALRQAGREDITVELTYQHCISRHIHL